MTTTRAARTWWRSTTRGKRAAILAKQLQAFGRRQTLRAVAVDLATVVTDAAPLLRRMLGDRVRLHVDVRAAVPAVSVDRAQIEQVLLALVVNARDAMPDGGTVTVATAAVEVTPAMAAPHHGVEPGAFGRLSVSDTGPAIDPDALPHVFEPFYSTRQMGRGTGLGLATIEGIVSQSHGCIEVVSEPGVGSTFSVLLPAAPEQPVRESGPARTTVATGTLLLVDDEEPVRRAIARLLRSLGWSVLEAAGPDEALALPLATFATLDLVVTDVLMPGMDGGALSDRLRERRPDLPVVFVSGFAPDATMSERLTVPRTAFLAKPFGRDEVIAAIARARNDTASAD